MFNPFRRPAPPAPDLEPETFGVHRPEPVRQGRYVTAIVGVELHKALASSNLFTKITLKVFKPDQYVRLYLAGNRLAEWNYFKAQDCGAEIDIIYRLLPERDAYGCDVTAIDVRLRSIVEHHVLVAETRPPADAVP